MLRLTMGWRLLINMELLQFKTVGTSTLEDLLRGSSHWVLGRSQEPFSIEWEAH